MNGSQMEIDHSDAEPAWEVAHLFPPQGCWCESDYFELKTNRIVELVDGRIEVPPAAGERHQIVLSNLFQQIHSFVRARDVGWALFAPFPLRVRQGLIRMPDMMVLRRPNQHLREAQSWCGADLVVEVLGEGDRQRELRTKRQEYARAGIAEYWIADPQTETICVLTPSGSDGAYVEAGVYRHGGMARSLILSGMTIDIAAVFDPWR